MKKTLLYTSIVGLLCFTFYYFFAEPKYSSEYIFEPFKSKRTICFAPPEDPSETTQLIDFHINNLKSRAMILMAIKEFQLDQLYSTPSNDLVKNISNNIDIQRIPDTRKISFNYSDESEEKAQQIAYALIQAHDQMCRDRQKSISDAAFEVLKGKIQHQQQVTTTSKIKFLQVSERLGINTHINVATLLPISDAAQTLKLSAEDLTRFSLAKGEYETELKQLKPYLEIEQLQLTDREFELLDPLNFHKYGTNEEVSDFMSKRRTISSK